MASQTLQDAQFKLNADAWSRLDGRKAAHENRVWQAFAPIFGAPGTMNAGKLAHIRCAFNGHTLSGKTQTSRARAYPRSLPSTTSRQPARPRWPSCRLNSTLPLALALETSTSADCVLIAHVLVRGDFQLNMHTIQFKGLFD